MWDIPVTEEMLDGVERRTAYLLAGIEDPEPKRGQIGEYNAETGTSEVIHEPPELPSGRALLAHFLQEGRPVNGRWVQIAKEAAIAELLTQEAK
jgi:hypothetical protein